MEQLTQEEAKIARELGLRKGDPNAAMSLFICYLSASEGYEQNLELASKYLHYAARLCHPEALHIIADLYGGGKFGDLKLTRNLNEQVKYLRMLCAANMIIDLDSIQDGKDKEKYQSYEWIAFATLGRLYVMEESLGKQDLGYAISLYLAEDEHMTEALYAMGHYMFYIKGEDYYMQSLRYFERALKRGNSFWADEAMRQYNMIAKYANENFQGPNGQIPYYE